MIRGQGVPHEIFGRILNAAGKHPGVESFIAHRLARW
jgi:hypothetical protein